MAQAEGVLGHCYLALRQPARARPHLENSHRALLDLYGPDHPTTRKAADYLKRLDPEGS